MSFDLDAYVESILTGKALAAFRASHGDVREVLRRRALSQWCTKDELAQRIVDWAGVSGNVLEPSCGTGAFVRACQARGCDVTSIDIDPRFAATAHRDYLKTTFTAQFDWSAQNPPYEKGLDADFLEKTAADANMVVALIRLQALAGTDRYERVWKHVNVVKLAIMASRPSFDLIDIETDSPRSDFVAVKYTINDAPFEGLEWWP